MDTLTIIQHNVLHWSFQRRQELSNLYISLSPDVILLNSTGMPDTDRIKIWNYVTYQSNASGENNSGVAIAIKRGIPHRFLDDFDHDVRAVEVQTIRGPVIVATTYLPPRRPIFPSQDIMRLMRKPIPAYIFADLNAVHTSLGHTRNNIFGNEIHRLTSRNLIQFLGPDFNTFLRGRLHGKPDVLFCNRFHNLNYALTQGPLSTSDHIPVVLKLSTRPILVAATPRPNLTQVNWDIFKDSLDQAVDARQEDDNQPKNQAYIDDKIGQWYDMIRVAKEAHIPMINTRTLPHPRESDALKLLQWRYNRIKTRIQIEGGTVELNQILRDIRDALRDECTHLYYEHWDNLLGQIDISVRYPGLFWKKVRQLMGSDTTIMPYVLHNNEKLYGQQEKEQCFREFWSETFTITAEENATFDAENERRVNAVLLERQEELVPFAIADLDRLDPENPLICPIDMTLVKRIIKGFQNKAPGISNVNKLILARLPDSMLDYYISFANESLSMGYFPLMFKKALLHFIGKPGKNHALVENYRPISLLEVPGKIFERILTERLDAFLAANDLINPNQFGFTKGKGTQTAITKLYETVAISQREKQGCNIISRDVRKAFDKVWHGGLKFKFLQTNMDGLFIRILSSFLDERTALIKMGTHIGQPMPLQSGVPQGSIMSPSLYCFYIHDIPPPAPGCLQLLFADDHTQVITYPNKNKIRLQRKTIREIESINRYEALWKISTNENKFQLLSVSVTKPLDIIVNNRLIPFNRHIKILGFQMGTRGTKVHITARIVAARSTLKRLKRFKRLSTKTFLHLYKALVRPRLEYPAIALTNARKTNMQRIQAVQNRMLRLAYKEAPPYYNTIKDLHLRCRMEPMNVRFHRLGNRTWDRLSRTEPELIDRSNELSRRPGRDHFNWKRLAPFIEGNQPRPIYRSGIHN